MRRSILAMAVVTCMWPLLTPTVVQAITFGDWATSQGYTPGAAMPSSVMATSAGIDSLTGINDYNWAATTSLNLGFNQLSSITSGDFVGMSNLKTLGLNNNALTSIGANAFTGLSSVTSLSLTNNQIADIQSSDFTGLDSLMTLNMNYNPIAHIDSGDFSGLDAVNTLYLQYCDGLFEIEPYAFSGLNSVSGILLSFSQVTTVRSNAFAGLPSLVGVAMNDCQITTIEPGVLTGWNNIQQFYVDSNHNLQVLNMDHANLSALGRFDCNHDDSLTHVSLRNSVLSQMTLATLRDGGNTAFRGLGDLPGITGLDLTGVDFSPITDLSPLYTMDGLTDIWLTDVKNLNANQLDTLLDNLAAMESTATEGVLYMTQADYDVLNTAGSGKLAFWDAEVGHHVQIIPEPAAAVMLAAALISLWLIRRTKR